MAFSKVGTTLFYVENTLKIDNFPSVW